MTLTLGEKYTSKQKDGSIYFTDVPQTIELTLSNLCRVVFCLIFHTCSIHKVYKRRYKDFNVTDYVRNLFFTQFTQGNLLLQYLNMPYIKNKKLKMCLLPMKRNLNMLIPY